MKAQYEYKCVECGGLHDEDFRESSFVARCHSTECDGDISLHKRHYTVFAHKPMMHDHFNHAVGAPISDMRHFRERLKVKSDEHANEIGMDVNYQPVDMGDHTSVGASGEGIYESNVTRSREGNPLLGEIKGEV